MRRARVVIQPLASREISRYASWIESQGSPAGAHRWLDAIETAINSLRSFPERCPLAPESEDVGTEIRQLLFASHRVLFVIKGNEVHVLYVRHTAQRRLRSDPP
ncbi:MAG: type II toxin-antitoxin system RelE/ParE family toxin [Phycisphaeraceae bacterium]|nr:type II toxin-antitoxin system RelE/ParE family toxin [Phycisphaeraceae bacterium]